MTRCPLGGCDAYGYCPCAEDPPDEAGPEQATALAHGHALKPGGSVRTVETLPPLDTYEPPEAT